MAIEAELAEVFDAERGRLVAVAHRILGRRSDAEDAVQEAWLRLARSDSETIDNLPGWLTTVVGRVAIDMLRARTSRHEVTYAADLPEPIVTVDRADAPDEHVARADSVGLALMVVLESLNPDERLAFVLHDLFGLPFRQIGQVLDKSTDAAKMLASRARRKVRGVPQPTGDLQARREVVDAFLAAAQGGDLARLAELLAPDITWTVHSPRTMRTMTGADEVAEALARGHRAGVDARRVLVDGEPGVLVRDKKGRPIGLMACTVIDGRMAHVESIVDPHRLAAMDLPGRDEV